MTHDGEPQHFRVELLVRHPTLTPDEITLALSLEPSIAHRIGDIRTTPKGTVLPGSRPDTRWRHVRRHETTGQWFASKVAELLAELEPHRDFLRALRATGGRAEVIVQFLGDGYFGDALPVPTLSRLADLDLELGLEIFVVPQF